MNRIKNSSSCNEQTTFFTGEDTSRLEHSYCHDSNNKDFLISKLRQLESILKTSITQNMILKHNSSKLQNQLQSKLISIQRINESLVDQNQKLKILYTEELDLNFDDNHEKNNFSFKNQVYNNLYNNQRQYHTALPSPVKNFGKKSAQKYARTSSKLSSTTSQKKLVGCIQKQKTNKQQFEPSSRVYEEVKKTHRKNHTTNFQSIDDIWNQTTLKDDRTTMRNHVEEKGFHNQNMRKRPIRLSYL